MVLCAIYLVKAPDQCDGMNLLVSAKGRVLFDGCHYIGVAITPDCTLQRLGQLYDRTFCPTVISSGVFMRNWAMCKKVQVEPKIFLKHRWIHFLGFLLIPNYNHDKIIREFGRSHRRTEILCFECRRIHLDCGREVNRVGLCLFANNSMINHAKTRMIDRNRKPTAVYLADAMCKGENKVGLLRFCRNI